MASANQPKSVSSLFWAARLSAQHSAAHTGSRSARQPETDHYLFITFIGIPVAGVHNSHGRQGFQRPGAGNTAAGWGFPATVVAALSSKHPTSTSATVMQLRPTHHPPHHSPPSDVVQGSLHSLHRAIPMRPSCLALYPSLNTLTAFACASSRLWPQRHLPDSPYLMPGAKSPLPYCRYRLHHVQHHAALQEWI
jgi:hypothetical protein